MRAISLFVFSWSIFAPPGQPLPLSPRSPDDTTQPCEIVLAEPTDSHPEADVALAACTSGYDCASGSACIEGSCHEVCVPACTGKSVCSATGACVPTGGRRSVASRRRKLPPGIPIALVGGGAFFVASAIFVPAMIATSPLDPDARASRGLIITGVGFIAFDALGIALFSAGTIKWLITRSRRGPKL